jgi:hypothetical protein
MIIQIDKWSLLSVPDSGCSLSYDVQLENAQRARINVLALVNPFVTAPPVPEIYVYCEMPGERFDQGEPVRRWIARPPHAGCPWSHVELPDKLAKEIQACLASASPLTS